MRGFRLLPRTKIPIPLIYFQRFISPFSSSAAASNPRFSNSFFDEAEGTSGVYRHALKFQRPSSIIWRKKLWNSASFIGTVVKPLKTLPAEDAPFCAYTVLAIHNSSQSNGTLKILLMMRDEMGKLCLNHLTPNDFIYVSGLLGTYTKADQNGILRLCYKVIVKELNYVMQRYDSVCQNHEETESREGQTDFEKYKNRLHLWQVFFTNPYEWWDNRKSKVNPRIPDFKHKDTGEALWLSPNDPPWIKQQLLKLDSTILEQDQGERIGRPARVSKWEYDA